MADPKTKVVMTAEDKTAAGFASATAGLKKFAKEFDLYEKLANPIAAAALAAGAASAALVVSVKSAVNTGDQLSKLSQKTGIAVESLSTLAYAGDLSGVSVESLANGIKKLSVNMADAATSATSKAADAFKALGIEVKTSDGVLRASDEVMGDIADRFATMKDSAGKTALAVALFGKAGADLIPMLNSGRTGLADFKDEAEKLGLVMSGKTAKSAEEFNDNLRKLSLSVSALGKSIADELLGPMAEYTRLVVEARKNGAGLFSSTVLGAQLSGAADKPLQELKDRAASLQGTISYLTEGGQKPTDFVFGARLKNAQAELAILQKIIAARIQAAQDFGPPVAPAEKKDAPPLGTDDAAAAAAKKLKADRERLIRLGQRNLGESGDSEEEARLLATARAQSEATKEFEALQRMLRRGEENELAAYYETAGEETMRLVAAQQELRKSGKDTFADLTNAVESWGNKAADTFADFVVDGKASFGDLVNSMLKDIVRLQAKSFLDPITKGANSFISEIVGNLFKPTTASANGNAFNSSGVIPFALGGIVNRPTVFPFAKGIGLMGEAGPEAILPLARGPNGKLGVQGGAGGGITVNLIENGSKAGQVEQRQSGGQSVVDIFVAQIRSAIAGDITRGSGPIPAALAGTYGLNRAAGGY